MKILKSLEELLYELVSWLVFYPITMWRSVRRPLHMMRYADLELSDRPESQYDDTLSPPLFLLITLLLSQGLSTAFPTVYDPSELPKALESGSNLLIARGVIFGIYPLCMSVVLLRRKSVPLTRASLRPPFFSQCFVAAPFVFVVGLAFDLLFMPGGQGAAAGAVVILLAILWYGQAQVRWFVQDLSIGAGRACLAFASAFLAATLAAAFVTILLGVELKTWS
ncbi:permease [Ensifer soli]|uniref:permease n=1 Tax=Ciceribacter sp. sgz301302 TaxID=3342379 RepID=UPI0035B87CAB